MISIIHRISQTRRHRRWTIGCWLLLIVLIGGCVSAPPSVTQTKPTDQNTQNGSNVPPIVEVLAVTPTPANESLLEETDQILFVSDRDGNQEIYRANADGSGLARLTDNRAADTDPIWSPDGQQIAFVSQRDGPDELYTMNLNGLDIERLTRFEAEVAQPTWSPDGTQIAFALHDDDTSVLAALDLESGTVMTISDRLQSIANPAWSPDGTMIAFASTDETVDQKRDIFRIDIRSPDESASLVNLTNHLGDDDHPAWQPVRANTARIAFHSNRDGNDEIYVMEANGAAQTRLTRNRTADTGPSWSSTGTAIAFTTGRTRESNSEIVVMRDDGSEQRSIIAFAARNEQVAWQPPPKIRRVNQLAFTLSNQPPLTSRNIVTMNEGGGSLAFVTNNLDVDTTTPAWSPDGSQIAFASNQSGNYDIWVINADGSGEARNLTGSFAARDMHPAWSPDGSEIAFESREPGNWDVFIVGADGTDEPRNITNHPASDGNPTWSPDGNEIAFATDRDDNFEIYAMRIDGTDSPRNLTRNPAKDVFPDWSPDPTNPQIVFRSTRNGLNQLFLFDLETNALRRLTSSNANDDQPSWSPDASTIAFASNRYPDDRAISENGKQQHYDIYLLEPASRNLLRLTSNPVDEMYPDWNPEP